MAGFTTTEFIWMNGELVPWDAAQVHVTAHGLHYGTGVFEGMRSYDTPDGPAKEATIVDGKAEVRVAAQRHVLCQIRQSR